ncbi:MAG: 3-deoxy-D-manno-octulosonic acid transferase [Desulfobacteraceae bacterium]|nr:3-deoxy-D-manno-octulosonic acid transferase [Desulfobacteraceae bacterium]
MNLLRPKRRETFLHRLGWTITKQVPPTSSIGSQRPVWIHALSVGEILSAEPLVNALSKALPGLPLVVSASTLTGMQTAQRLFAGKVQSLFYFPYDLIFSVRHIAKEVNPRLVVIVETDIWPNFLRHFRHKRVPVMWVNARLSISTVRGYRLLGGFSKKVLNYFTAVGAQSQLDADRLFSLGLHAEKIHLTGNVKFDQPGTDAPVQEGNELRRLMGIDARRRIIILGSTHAGEEEIGLAVYADLKKKFSDLLLIVAPRDPGRADAVIALARAMGLKPSALSALSYDEKNGLIDILVVNTIGLLRRLYSIADIAIVGGSLVKEGGHNPLEPAAYAKPILFGSDMSDFAAVAELLEQGGGAKRVDGKLQLYQETETLLVDSAGRSLMGGCALKVFQSNKGAVEKTVALITKALQ